VGYSVRLGLQIRFKTLAKVLRCANQLRLRCLALVKRIRRARKRIRKIKKIKNLLGQATGSFKMVFVLPW
jgi:hypothetical protein